MIFEPATTHAAAIAKTRSDNQIDRGTLWVHALRLTFPDVQYVLDAEPL